MRGPRGGPFRVGREHQVREVLLVALVPGDSGSTRVCLLMGRRASVGELMPLHAYGPGLAEAYGRRSYGHYACAFVGVRNVVGTCCAKSLLLVISIYKHHIDHI